MIKVPNFAFFAPFAVDNPFPKRFLVAALPRYVLRGENLPHSKPARVKVRGN
jgi:hypothetical protein